MPRKAPRRGMPCSRTCQLTVLRTVAQAVRSHKRHPAGQHVAAVNISIPALKNSATAFRVFRKRSDCTSYIDEQKFVLEMIFKSICTQILSGEVHSICQQTAKIDGIESINKIWNVCWHGIARVNVGFQISEIVRHSLLLRSNSEPDHGPNLVRSGSDDTGERGRVLVGRNCMGSTGLYV